MVRLGYLLSAASNIINLIQEEQPQISDGIEWGWKKWFHKRSVKWGKIELVKN